MIDWLQLFGNGLWILGGAIALATLSYAIWQSGQRRQRLGAVLGQRSYALVLDLAGVLLSSGLLLTAGALFEKGLWAMVGLGFLVQVMLLLRRKPVQD